MYLMKERASVFLFSREGDLRYTNISRRNFALRSACGSKQFKKMFEIHKKLEKKIATQSINLHVLICLICVFQKLENLIEFNESDAIYH